MNTKQEEAVMIVLQKVENQKMTPDEAMSLILALTDGDTKFQLHTTNSGTVRELNYPHDIYGNPVVYSSTDKKCICD